MNSYNILYIQLDCAIHYGKIYYFKYNEIPILSFIIIIINILNVFHKLKLLYKNKTIIYVCEQLLKYTRRLKKTLIYYIYIT